MEYISVSAEAKLAECQFSFTEFGWRIQRFPDREGGE